MTELTRSSVTPEQGYVAWSLLRDLLGADVDVLVRSTAATLPDAPVVDLHLSDVRDAVILLRASLTDDAEACEVVLRHARDPRQAWFATASIFKGHLQRVFGDDPDALDAYLAAIGVGPEVDQ